MPLVSASPVGVMFDKRFGLWLSAGLVPEPEGQVEEA